MPAAVARIGPEPQQEVRRSEVIEAENATMPLPEGVPSDQ